MDLGESARDKKQAKKAKNEALRRIGIRVPNEKMPYNILKSMKKTHARRQKKRDEEDLASGLVTAKSSKKKKRRSSSGILGSVSLPRASSSAASSTCRKYNVIVA